MHFYTIKEKCFEHEKKLKILFGAYLVILFVVITFSCRAKNLNEILI